MNKTIIFVPYWIEKALSRNNHTLRDIVDYTILRKYISQNDLSGLLGFQQSPEVDVLNTGSKSKNDTVSGSSCDSLLSRWEISADERYREELDSTIVPMSYSLEKETLTRLKSSLESTDVETPIFKVIDIQKDITLVVVYEGFLEGIKDTKTRYALIKQLLTLSYVYCKVEKVSETLLFSSYLDLLQSSTVETRTASTVE